MPRKELAYVAARKRPAPPRKPGTAKTPKTERRRNATRRAPVASAKRHELSGPPPLGRRPTPWLEPALEAALEAIPLPAFLLDPVGNVLLANTKGHARVREDDHDTLLAAVRAAERGNASRFEVTALEGDGAGHVLVVERAGPPSLEDLVLRVAHRYALTRSQVKVLSLIADGLQNWAIARELGISERTVEAHVTGILDKLGVETRAGAVATVLGIEPSRS